MEEEEEEKGGINAATLQKDKEQLGYSYVMIEILSFMSIKDQHRMIRISRHMTKLVSHMFKESFQRF
jgi:hypothetical protein